MKNILLIIIFFLLIISCNNRKHEKDIDYLKSYHEALTKFTPNQVSHFPHDLTNLEERKLYVYNPDATEYNFKAGLIFNAWTDSTTFFKLKQELEQGNISNYSINNDSLIFIGDTITDYSSLDKGAVVPSFLGVKNKFGLSGIRLQNNEHAYIIESKAGEYLESEYLVNNLKLPDEWKHGFSRGIAIDNTTYRVIYWLVIW